MTQVISQRETLPCVRVSTKYKKKTGNWGPGPWNSEIMDRDRGIPKLLRNYSETGEPWNSEITPKLLRNYSEIGDRGTMELLRNYGTGTVAVELRKLWLAIVLY